MIEAEEVQLGKKKTIGLHADPLLNQLEQIETRLQSWLKKSKGNAELFRSDPIAALRAAGVDLEDDTIMELEMIASGIARKLR